mgnify:CR=1 FL=1
MARNAKSVEAHLILQFVDRSVTYEELIQNAKNVWQFDMNRDPAEIKKLELYVKPEEDRTYFVVNDTETGDFYI